MAQENRHNPKIAFLVEQFMKKVEEVATDEDWTESDGWLGRMVLRDHRGEQSYIYEIKDGKMTPAEQDGRTFTATITMSIDTFLDVMDAALDGRGGEVFSYKYARRHIIYDGEHWIVDSERFAKVFKRMGAAQAVRG